MPSAEEILQALRDSQTSLEESNPFLKVMIYGNSGMGKTVTAMDLAQRVCPAGKRIAYVDAVEGWVSALNHPEKHLTRNVSRFQYQGYSQLQTLAQAIEAEIDGFDFGVIILDEFSTMTKRDLDVVLKARAKKDPTKDKDAPTQPDFYANTERMRKLLVGEESTPGLLQLPIHVIVVAHERVDKNDMGQETIAPSFMPKFNEIIKGNLHVVARLTNELSKAGTDEEEIVRVLQAFPYRRIDAKTRIAGLGEVVDVEMFCGILAEWAGEETEVSVPADENVDDDGIDDDTFGGIVADQ